ncbi:MAG: dienelactone hydrolase family protein, partial [Thermoguttaceae bacterium]|nr:dienelactone hydrolase family protein [Thermoguttaceae bacterium]
WVQEGQQPPQEGWGQEGPQPPQQGWGDQGGNPRAQGRNREPRVSLEDALKNADGVTPIQLNQSDFTASDGVRLSGVYFKGKGDQDTPVVVLLHDLKGKSDSYMPMAQQLAQQGFGVLIPNLRGEGGSGALQMGPGNNNPPNDRPQAQKQISSRDINAMINIDREVWFTFLAYLNNLQYCNVKKTVIVGSGFGAALASSWAKSDWNSKGTVAQNVVGLVLLSPDADNGQDKYNSLVSLEAVRKRVKFPTFGYLVFVGKMNEEKFKDAQEIQQKMGGKVADESTPMEDRACPLVALQTELQGDELLGFESFGVANTIVQYVALRMKKLPKKRDKWEEIVEKKSRRN